MNIAIIGCGAIARAHGHAVAHLRRLPEWSDLRLAAVVGSSPEATAAFAEEFGCETATIDLESVLMNRAIDAVIVCSPTDLHVSHVEAALQASKHVLCEIPLATSLAETDRMIRIAQDAGLTLMICHTLRFQSALMETRQRIATGALHPYSAVARYLFLARDNVGRTGRTRSWTDNLLWHHGCHAVDTVLWLLDGQGEAELFAQASSPSAHGIPMDIVVGLRTDRDGIGSIALSYNCHQPILDFVVVGEEDSVVVGSDRFRTQLHIVADGIGHPIVRQDAEFYAAVRERRSPAVSAQTIRPTMAALQAIQDILDEERKPTA